MRLKIRRKSDELPLNVYHFVIKAPDVHGYPVYACKEGKSIAKHWSEWDDVEAAYNSASSAISTKPPTAGK